MKILHYQTVSGRLPFREWYDRLDGRHQAAVRRRARAIEAHGHFGDCRTLRGGLYELRLIGPGLRIYFATIDGAIVLLLGGSGKSDQRHAIKKARQRLKDFREWNDD